MEERRAGQRDVKKVGVVEGWDQGKEGGADGWGERGRDRRMGRRWAW